MQVRDSVAEAITEDPEGRSLRRGMEAVLETLVQDVARDLVTVRAQHLRVSFVVLFYEGP